MNTNPQIQKAFVLGRDEFRTREVLDILGEPGRIKLAGTDVGDAAAVIHLTVPKLSGPPLHRHSREDEWFYVLKGEIVWEVEGRRHAGGVGASAFLPRGVAHTFQNFRDDVAELLVMVTPAGLDRFFEQVSEQNKGLSQPDLGRVGELMGSFGLELLGPPLSA